MKIFKRILILLLVLVLLAGIAGGVWYFFFRDGATLLRLARHLDGVGRYDWATRCYRWAWDREPDNSAIPIELAESYAASGNYTKCEATLWEAIEQAPGDLNLYLTLSQVYVAQDKLLDASRLDEQIADPQVRSAFNAQRPAAPVIQPEGGEYDEDCTVSLSYSSGTAYWTLTGDYPSAADDAYTAPVRLAGQEATVVALVVGETGLVSPAVTADYVVGFVDEAVTIADPALDAALRESMGWVEGLQLTTGLLAQVQDLTLTAEVTDLSQLSLLINLSSLDVSALPGAQDWTVLAGMRHLETLILPPETLDTASLQTIGALTTLRELYLADCGITSLAPLTDLTALEVLDLTGGSVSDCTPLAGMTNLRALYLDGNAVSDLTPLANLTALEELTLRNNPLTGLEPLRGLRQMQQLDISATGVTALDALVNMTGLTSLKASDNRIAAINVLSRMTALTELDLSHNAITDCTALGKLTELIDLNLSYNELTAIPAFSADCKLTFVNLSHNQLESVEGLKDLPRINYVYLDYNQITDLLPLTNCFTLVQVDAFENPTKVAQELIDMGVIVHYTPVFDEETGEELSKTSSATDGEVDEESADTTSDTDAG